MNWRRWFKRGSFLNPWFYEEDLGRYPTNNAIVWSRLAVQWHPEREEGAPEETPS